ncbi:hypothetical protein [Pseudarthrobacter sp. S9]|uniref:hypothetical protein n=1 Tax=Pseudarthrobacter sp. S9 TaxID=3418421 RepID=UPI003D015BEA
MPYQEYSSAAGFTGAHTRETLHQPTAPPHSFRVIPGVDLTTGTVSFLVDGELERHWYPEPHRIAEALAGAVRPARWHPATRVLTLTVAAAGRRSGIEKHFSFGRADQGLLY